MNRSEPTQNDEKEQAFDRDFKPRGAIVFFVLITIVGMVIWYTVYFLMLARK